MDRRLLSRAAAAGAVAGAAVLGILGRVATALLAISMDLPANVSARGLAEVTLLGAAAGALGGLLLPILGRPSVRRGLGPGVIVGLAVFAVMLIAALAGHRVSLTATGPLPMTLGVAAAACIVYGVTAHALLRLIERRVGVDPERRPASRRQ